MVHEGGLTMNNRKKVENYLQSTAGRFLNKAAIEKYCKIPKYKVTNSITIVGVRLKDAEIERIHDFLKEVMFYEY